MMCCVLPQTTKLVEELWRGLTHICVAAGIFEPVQPYQWEAPRRSLSLSATTSQRPTSGMMTPDCSVSSADETQLRAYLGSRYGAHMSCTRNGPTGTVVGVLQCQSTLDQSSHWII